MVAFQAVRMVAVADEQVEHRGTAGLEIVDMHIAAGVEGMLEARQAPEDREHFHCTQAVDAGIVVREGLLQEIGDSADAQHAGVGLIAEDVAVGPAGMGKSWELVVHCKAESVVVWVAESSEFGCLVVLERPRAVVMQTRAVVVGLKSVSCGER